MRNVVALIASVPITVAAIAACGAGRAPPSSAGGGAQDAGPDLDGSLSLETSPGTCPAPVTCATANATCGPIGDGCGSVLDCGQCTPPQTCGGGGVPSACGGESGCVPQTCASQGISCGPAGDGCGGLLQCGSCSAPNTCGGGGTPNVCGHTTTCVPTTCGAQGISCGPAGDGCGGLLQCGSCAPPATCGGGGTPGVCGGSNACVPKTCATIGATCGPAADGCGGLLQCGSCSGQSICGGGGVPNVCGGQTSDGGPCTNLCLAQVQCNGGSSTTVSGTVLAPNGVDPLYNAVVYVPNAPVQPFSPGVACDQCGAAASGSPLVTAVSAADGTFQLHNVPTGTNIPLVIQIGRWRRQVTIPSVPACTNTTLPAAMTRLPRNQGEGDIPRMAFSTGAVDALECVLRKIGVDDGEFTLPPAQGGSGRINLYTANGAGVGFGTPSANQLYGSLTTLSQYDMVLFPCEGGQLDKPRSALQNLVQYANAGGRVFATHYSYAWLYNNPPFSTTAVWAVNQSLLPNLTGYLDTSFPKGQAFAQWLVDVGASSVFGRIPLQVIRHDVDGVVAPSQRWIYADPSISSTAIMHFTFNTPVGAAANQQCGRVLFDDFHVEDAQTSGLTFPAECSGGPMTPQEKVLEFMIFDLGSCVTPDMPPPPTCTPLTCAQQNIACGPAGDGCGGTLQCGSCPVGQTCGGGGTPSACGGMPCAARTCAQQNIACGPAGDGCGGQLDCGRCPAGQTCGGGGPGVCGTSTCAPSTCAAQHIACGPAGDGCGARLDCGNCPPGQTCGGGGTIGVCGAPPCTPVTCVGVGANCGVIADGCGGLAMCGACVAPEICGGGGTPNVCGGNPPAR